MAKTSYTTEIEGMATDGYDTIDVVMHVEVSGRKNLPNGQNLGKACDGAKYILQKLLEVSYIKDPQARELATQAARHEARTLVGSPIPTPVPEPKPEHQLEPQTEQSEQSVTVPFGANR